MYSSSQNRNKNKPTSQSIKKQRPRPQWTTDFIDRQQFKLSQAQMIQKKAALQSKHRQEAKRQLEQRRKKLQMGIIDDETRKVYQTALTSKNIDINPPIRKNLTQMIRYEKQQKQKRILNQQDYDQQFDDQSDEDDQYQKQLKEAQNFIKKFEKAKKQEKIQRAVQILSNNRSQVVDKEKRLGQNSQSETRINNFMNVGGSQNSRQRSLKKQKGSQQSQSFSRDDALTSIEDTIKFMQQKLFAAKKTVQQHSKSFISQQNSQDQSQFFQKKRNKFSDDDDQQIIPVQKPTFKKQQRKQQQEIQFNTKSQNILPKDEELQFNERIAQISQLRIKFKDENDSQQDDECLNTIRRMREQMENKQGECDDNEKKYSQMLKENIRDNQTSPSVDSLGWNSTIFKKPNHSVLESEAEVSFSLTNNNDDEYQQQSSLLNLSKSKIKGNSYFGNQKINNVIGQNNYFDFKPAVDFSKKQKSKQDEYEDEYQKIKQNLFNCINSNDSDISDIKINPKNYQANLKKYSQNKKMFQKFHQDSDEQQQSQDSLMVRDKINLWKHELQHQAEPQDEDDDQQQQYQYNDKQDQNRNTNTKTTFMNINTKSKFTHTQIINKQTQEDDDQQDDDSAYKYSYYQQNNTQSHSQFNRFQPQSTISQFSNTNISSTNSNIIKKPPIAKKTQNTQKFEEMKKMLSNTTNQIQKIQIQPLKIQPLTGNTQMLGFDFRGSINIKKNVLSK